MLRVYIPWLEHIIKSVWIEVWYYFLHSVIVNIKLVNPYLDEGTHIVSIQPMAAIIIGIKMGEHSLSFYIFYCNNITLVV